MPYYEYECDGCGFVTERFMRSIPRTIPTHLDGKCENCQRISTFKRIISAPNFHLKGGGWARDGYSGSSQDGSRVVSLTEPK